MASSSSFSLCSSLISKTQSCTRPLPPAWPGGVYLPSHPVKVGLPQQIPFITLAFYMVDQHILVQPYCFCHGCIKFPFQCVFAFFNNDDIMTSILFLPHWWQFFIFQVKHAHPPYITAAQAIHARDSFCRSSASFSTTAFPHLCLFCLSIMLFPISQYKLIMLR